LLNHKCSSTFLIFILLCCSGCAPKWYDVATTPLVVNSVPTTLMLKPPILRTKQFATIQLYPRGRVGEFDWNTIPSDSGAPTILTVNVYGDDGSVYAASRTPGGNGESYSYRCPVPKGKRAVKIELASESPVTFSQIKWLEHTPL
jgi:hypothetical protein